MLEIMHQRKLIKIKKSGTYSRLLKKYRKRWSTSTINSCTQKNIKDQGNIDILQDTSGSPDSGLVTDIHESSATVDTFHKAETEDADAEQAGTHSSKSIMLK